MATLDDAKLALRISNTAYNTEIQGLIDACKIDLQQSGVLVVSETDALTKQAIVTYCKANFGLNNPDSEKLQQSYNMIKNHLSLSSDYAYFTIAITSTGTDEITFDGETKQTNTSGTAVFYSRAKNHVEYIVDGVSYYTDVTASATITVGGE